MKINYLLNKFKVFLLESNLYDYKKSTDFIQNSNVSENYKYTQVFFSLEINSKDYCIKKCMTNIEKL